MISLPAASLKFFSSDRQSITSGRDDCDISCIRLEKLGSECTRAISPSVNQSIDVMFHGFDRLSSPASPAFLTLCSMGDMFAQLMYVMPSSSSNKSFACIGSIIGIIFLVKMAHKGTKARFDWGLCQVPKDPETKPCLCEPNKTTNLFLMHFFHTL
jgi:hypothetical protein